jgi:putative membrane protein
MDDSMKEKAADLTHFIFEVPSYRKLVFVMLSVSFLAGFLLHAAFKVGGHQPLLDSVFFGGADGVILFGIPALVASVLATSILSLSSFRQASKYFLLIAVISMSVFVATYLLGLAAIGGLAFPAKATEFVLFAAALMIAIWFVSLRVPLTFDWKKSIVVAFVHPLLQLSFLFLWRAYALVEIHSPVLLALQFGVASAVLLLAMWSLMVIINAPVKRNFGVSAIQASALFFAQWMKGGKGLEEIIAEVGALIETEVGTVGFRTRDGKLKASFVVPLVHFGPVGTLGGSEYPALISAEISRKLGGTHFVFHGTVTHDYNPVFSSSHVHISQKAAELLGNARGYSPNAEAWESRDGNTRVFMLAVGRDRQAFAALTRAPYKTDDISLSLGFSARNLILSKGFSHAIVVDMHNSCGDELDMTAGSSAYYELEDSIRDLALQSEGRLQMGIAFDSLSDFTPAQGIGRAGLRAAVFKIAKKRYCIILLDANNAYPTFRMHILESLAQYCFDFVDIFTTDSHAVNVVGGVHNPLGGSVSSHQLVHRVKAAVARAVADIEPVSAKASSCRISIHVLGANRTSELVSTINAVIAILRIIGPVIVALSLALAFIALILVGKFIL